jgi:hypothetical protein
VATDGTGTDGPYPETKEHLGGFAVVDVPSREEALEWAAKIAFACRLRKRYGSSCPTRASDRRRPATLEHDLPWPRSDHAGLRINLIWGPRGSDPGSGEGRSPVLVPDRIAATTDRPVERPARHIAASVPASACPCVGGPLVGAYAQRPPRISTSSPQRGRTSRG